MIQQAIATDDPVIFYEPKRRYWDKGEVDESRLARAGCSRRASSRRAPTCTVVAYGPMVKTCLQAAQAAEDEGKSLEVVDLRSLEPARPRHRRRLGREDRPAGRRPRGVDATSASAPRSRRAVTERRSTRWRRRCCASAATTCLPAQPARGGVPPRPRPRPRHRRPRARLLRQSLSRQGNSPYAGPAVPTPRSRRGPHRGRDRHLAGRQGRHREGQRHRRRGRDREVPRRAAGPVRGPRDRAARRRGRHGRGRHADHLGRDGARRADDGHGRARAGRVEPGIEGSPAARRSTRASPAAAVDEEIEEGKIGGTTSTGRTAVLVGYGVKQTEAKRRPRKAGAAAEHFRAQPRRVRPLGRRRPRRPDRAALRGRPAGGRPRAAAPVASWPSRRSASWPRTSASSLDEVDRLGRGWRHHPCRRRGPRLRRARERRRPRCRPPVRRERRAARSGSRSRACAR